MYTVLSFQISDSIDVKSFKSIFKAELIFNDTDELFYKDDSEHYVYVFKYGVVCFLNYDESKYTAFLKLISPYCKNLFEYKLSEEFQIETNSPENKFGFNKIEIAELNAEILRVIMLNVSQSVALDYYSEQTKTLLEDTNEHTVFLEKKGNLNISGRKLKRFIGKTINLKNQITENLYIFDSVPETWEDENLNNIDVGLKKTFDLQSRYRNIHEELQIIKDNLGLLIDLMHHKKSSALEVVVIILILVEVLNLILEKIFSII